LAETHSATNLNVTILNAEPLRYGK